MHYTFTHDEEDEIIELRQQWRAVHRQDEIHMQLVDLIEEVGPAVPEDGEWYNHFEPNYHWTDMFNWGPDNNIQWLHRTPLEEEGGGKKKQLY